MESIVDGAVQKFTSVFQPKAAEGAKVDNNVAAQQSSQQAASAARSDEAGLSDIANKIASFGSKIRSTFVDDDAPAKPRFSITDASKYSEGSDVQKMAYAIADKGDHDSVDLSEYTVLKAKGGSNSIEISKAEHDGLTVRVDGQEHTFTAEEAKKLIIDGGSGDDSIIADRDVVRSLHIVGGKGNDSIRGGGGNDLIFDNYGSNSINAGAGDDKIIANHLDYEDDQVVEDSNKGFFGRLFDKLFGDPEYTGNNINGGGGNDYIEGGFGDDYINGGAGNDVIYGLDGSDVINAGRGRDYVDGGLGDDTINAGSGNDMVFGGKGNDQINASSGENVIAGGKGKDTINAGWSSSHISTDGKDDINAHGSVIETVKKMSVPSNFKVEGDEAFKARVESDYETLSSIAPGQAMLRAISDSGKDVTTKEVNGGNYCSYSWDGVLNDDRTANSGSDSSIGYNRSRIRIGTEGWGERPPLVRLFHEMAHSYDAANGILDGNWYNYDGTDAKEGDAGAVKGAELQAVGLDVGANVELNPEGVSENDMRRYLGLDTRPRY